MPLAPVNSAQAAPKSIATGLFLAIAGAIAFSGKAIIVKLAYRHGVDAVTLIMLRMLMALPFFLAIVWWTGRKARPTSPMRSGCMAVMQTRSGNRCMTPASG